ncbi:AbrB family transcriptional regulator (plasmid) [Pseudomonas oryzihabitans]|nr:AbrB family transcriptional regulator [Pseudomonas psychrotolerans]
MSSATVTSKGQITIPVEVRALLGIESGDRVAFVQTGDRAFALVPVNRRVTELKGFLKHQGEAVSLEQMNEAIGQGATL